MKSSSDHANPWFCTARPTVASMRPFTVSRLYVSVCEVDQRKVGSA